MSVNKSLQAILAPQVTEKATMVADKHNQIAFKVKKDATNTIMNPKLDPEVSKFFIRITPTKEIRKNTHWSGFITSDKKNRARIAVKIGDIYLIVTALPIEM